MILRIVGYAAPSGAFGGCVVCPIRDTRAIRDKTICEEKERGTNEERERERE